MCEEERQEDVSQNLGNVDKWQTCAIIQLAQEESAWRERWEG